MLRFRDFLTAFYLLGSSVLSGYLANAAQYSSNMFLNGEYKNSISAHPESQYSVNPASNIFLNHAIISRQASPFQGPTYLPPTEYLKCGKGQHCVRQNQCQSGYFTELQPKILNCNPETDVCCTYRPPPTTTTPKPFITCNKDSDCVSAKDCHNGEIVASDYIKRTVTNACYAPEVCCRMPSTTLTSDGYILHKPDKSFPLPTNPTTSAQRTTPLVYRPAPSQTNVVYQPQPTPASTSLAPYRPQPTQLSTYRPQPPAPTKDYLPPQTSIPVKTPSRPQPTQPIYPQPQPTRPAPTPYRPQPNNEYLPPQTTASRPQPQPSYPQPTQTAYKPEPQPSYRPNEGRQTPPPPPPTPPRSQPTQPVYRPQPTQPVYRPQPTQPVYRPQPTQPVYRPQPTQPPRPQPTQFVYRPQPTQSPRPQPDYRPQTPNNQYLPPDSLNEIDRQPEPSNVNPVQRGEDQLSPQIFPTPKTPKVPPKTPSVVSVQGPAKSYAKCASALVCTAENYCNSIGVISETPVELSSYNAAFRVPLTDCIIPETGAEGKCCRDPNYVDPWPVNLAGVCANRNKNTKPTGIKDIDANFAEIPWQAMILKESTKSLLCGGAIIGDEFVLTTASCVSGVSVGDVRIKAGEWELGSTTEPQPFQLVGAKTIDVHPNYNPSTGANDMAIIRLQNRFEFATHIQPICISDEDPSPSEQCITTGWGKQALQIHEEGAIMHVTNTSPLSRSDCGADGTSVCGSTKFDSCEFDVGSALACGTGSSVRLKGIYVAENACGENQGVRFSKPDIKWINTAFVDRNKPLLLKRV